MSSLSVRLPDSLHKQVRELAKQDNVSINQFIVSAVTEKTAAFITCEYLEERANLGSKKKFLSALAQVPSNEPDPMDKLS